MSVNNIPFDIQTEIMQRLPVKSLVRFQLVSKQWKSLIDSPEFITNHCRAIDTHYQHHLFVLQAPDRDYTYHYTFKYLSIIDNDVYPDQKSSYTIPPLLRSFRNIDKDYFTCVNESLGVLEYDSDGGCGVWMMDFATKSFSKMFTVKVPGQLLYNGVLGFRKNGEVIIKAKDDNKYGLAAYEPSSGRVKGIQIHGGIKEYGNYGKYGTLVKVTPYMESLLLLDQTSSIIP
ncbi:putative F-box domain-containing protein [Tanacetum coccineum]